MRNTSALLIFGWQPDSFELNEAKSLACSDEFKPSAIPNDVDQLAALEDSSSFGVWKVFVESPELQLE